MRPIWALLALSTCLVTSTGQAQNDRFTRSTDTADQPVVTDNVTALVWQGCAGGLSGDDCATGSAAKYTWKDALSYCEDLTWGGYSDWRLPDRKELHGITDKGRANPAIDVGAFPATPSSRFWSSSSCAGNGDYAWYVSFSSGYVGFLNSSDKSYDYHARCVRGGP